MIVKIQGSKKRDVYYYDKENMTISDKEGNIFKLYEDLEGMSDFDKVYYLDSFFHDYYTLMNRFKNICKNVKQHADLEWFREK